MNKEIYIRTLIKNSGDTIKGFAEKIGLPYTTLTGILNRGIDGASVQNVMKICKALKITVEDLQKVEDAELNNENNTNSGDLITCLGERYNLKDEELSLENISQSRNWLKTGGELDLERTAIYVLRDFRDGKTGKFVLDDIEE